MAITYAKNYILKNVMKKPVDFFNNEGKVWNTGLAMCECPHVDEIANSGKALLVDTTINGLPELKELQVAVQIYGNRNIVAILNAEDEVTVAADTDEAAQFYLDQAKDGILEVTPKN